MNPAQPASLDLRGVEVQLGQREILRNLDLRVLPGEFCVLLGGANAGKSTLLRAIAGLDPLTRGEIWVDDRQITHARVQRRGTVLMQPGFPLWPHFTVTRNITFTLKYRGLDRRARNQRASELLGAVGLSEFGRHLPEQLTPGQRQRVALARSLAAEAPITLLDEPFSAQDLQLRDQLLMLLKQRHQQLGQTIVIATEDPQQALRLADRIAVLNDGEIEQTGTPQELYAAPVSRHVAALLGRANLIAGTIEHAGDQPLFRADNGIVIPLFEHKLKRARLGWAMFRPRDLSLITRDDEPFGDRIRLTGRIAQTEFLGSRNRCVVDVAGLALWMDEPCGYAGRGLQIGDSVVVGIDPAAILVLER